MGAEIEWHDGKRVGTIRFGSAFVTAVSHDPWSGVMSIQDEGARCYLYAIAGTVTRQDIEDALQACADAGFLEATEDRRGKKWIYDLTARPFKRKRL